MDLQHFWSREDGAVTVDFVVMTAAVVGLGVAATSSVRTGVCTLGHDIDMSLTSASVVQLGELGAGAQDTYGGACGGTAEHPVMDCGTVWDFGVVGSITGADGNSYYVNADNVVIDPNGGPMPLMIRMAEDADGNFVTFGPYDMAGRLVNNSGVPLPPAANC